MVSRRTMMDNRIVAAEGSRLNLQRCKGSFLRNLEIQGKTIQNSADGQSPPSPEHPQEIVNAGKLNEETGRYEISCKFANQNLLDKNSLQDGFVKSDGTVENVTWIKCTDYIRIQGGSYLYIDTIYTTSNIRYVAFYDGSHRFISGVIQNIKQRVDIPSDAVYVRFNINNAYLDEAIASIDDVPAIYTEHRSRAVTVSSPVSLSGWDKLVKRDGIWGWSIRGFRLALDGSENWLVHNTFAGFALECLPETWNHHFGYCNQLIWHNGNYGADQAPDNAIWIGGHNNRIYCVKNSFYDDTLGDRGLMNWKTHLSSHPLEIITYNGEETAFYPRPEEEQKRMDSLHTYTGVTNVTIDSGEVPATIRFLYRRKI